MYKRKEHHRRNTLEYELNMLTKTVLLCFFACISYINAAPARDAAIKKTQADFIFDSLDSDNNGKVSLSEAKAFWKKFGLTDKQVEEVFKNADANGDAFITKEEFNNYATDIPVRTGEDLLKGTFDKIDSDNDGFITLEEAQKFYLQFGKKSADVAAWFQKVDKNGNGKLSYEEFKKNAESS